MTHTLDITEMIDTSLDYDQEDKKMLKRMKNTSYTSLKDTQASDFAVQKKLLTEAAKSHRKTKKLISFRISESDINKIKSMAEEQGIPYQTLISAFIHKLANKKIELTLK